LWEFEATPTLMNADPAIQQKRLLGETIPIRVILPLPYPT
jgi:hypothetical protein